MSAHDVVIVGAGVAGSAAARAFARAGRRVALVDARPFDDAGARWVNGVPDWMFDAAGVPRPEAPERRPAGPFVMLDAAGTRRQTVDPSPAQPIDMRLLGERLRADAFAAGAEGLDAHRVVDLALDGRGRPRRLTLDGPGGRRDLEAQLFVDAAGMKGVLRRRVPALADACPKVPGADVCSAAQAVFHLRDAAAARRWLDAQGARPLETLSRTGVAGGYSIGNVMVDVDGDEVELLTGSVPAEGNRDGPHILSELLEDLPWIGERIFGGQGAIPIRRPYAHLTHPGLALLGDAACQVFPAHGSGIGIGLIAARLLADSTASAADPGARAVVWRYGAQFHHQWGGLLAGYDLFRRLSQSLAPEETAALLASGLLTPTGTRAALAQRLPRVPLRDLPKLARGLTRTPRLGTRLLAVLGWMPAITAWAKRFPQVPDEAARDRWASRMDALFVRATGRP
ncbi:MAG: FAD-dependent oxidoreductase [bacterium]